MNGGLRLRRMVAFRTNKGLSVIQNSNVSVLAPHARISAKTAQADSRRIEAVADI